MYPWREQLGNAKLHGFIQAYEDHASKHAIPFHNATPDFEELENPQAMYLDGDPHFNYEGQRVWAESLIAFLKPQIASH